MAESEDILTERLRIIPFREKHLTGRYVGWLNDKKLMRYSEQRHKIHTIETCRVYLESFQNTPNYFWAIETKDEALGHIGNINAYVDVNNLIADLGILIGERRAANRHFGLEAWSGVCRFLFEHNGVRKVTAGTIATNTSMIRLASRAGMSPDGTRRRHYLWEGQEVDIELFGLFANRLASI